MEAISIPSHVSDYNMITQIMSGLVVLMKALQSFSLPLGTSMDHTAQQTAYSALSNISVLIDKFVKRQENSSQKNELEKLLVTLNNEVQSYIKEWNQSSRTVTRLQIAITSRELTSILKGLSPETPHAVEQRTNSKAKSSQNSVVRVSVASASAGSLVVPPAGQESSNSDNFLEFQLLFPYLSISDCLRIASVCSTLKNHLDNPEVYRNKTISITSRMFIKKEDDKKQVPPNKSSDYASFVKIQPEVTQFLETKGSLITCFILRTPDAKEATIFLRSLSSRITHLTFSFTEIVEPLFADNQFWVEVLESTSLVYLNFQETKLSKMQVPVQIRDKIKKITYPPFVYNAYACYDYTHPDQNSKEFFNFKAGDKFQILPSARNLQGWKIAVNEQGEKGFVPGNYLVMLDDKKK
jgi:hypothetical protein